MTTVDPATVARVAELARLEVAPGTKRALVEQIGRILEYVSQVEGVEGDGDDADDPSPWALSPIRLRNDEPHPGPLIDLGTLTDVARGFVVVPHPPGMD